MSPPPSGLGGGPETLGDAVRALLLTPDPRAKARGARDLVRRWQAGDLPLAPARAPWPDRPARPARPLLLPPACMPRRGGAGSPRTRVALLHALAHIELNAIDLALDTAGRFGPAMPPAFASDWLAIAAEEGLHFLLLRRLLARAGAAYGDLPAHDGLWQAAIDTAGDAAARLAVVPQVLEARGLDVAPGMIARLEAAGDRAAAVVLRRILADEVGHVAAGNRWFRHIARESGRNPAALFRELVTLHFRGGLKPPFNDSARHQAGLTTDWYAPLGTRAAGCK